MTPGVRSGVAPSRAGGSSTARAFARHLACAAGCTDVNIRRAALTRFVSRTRGFGRCAAAKENQSENPIRCPLHGAVPSATGNRARTRSGTTWLTSPRRASLQACRAFHHSQRIEPCFIVYTLSRYRLSPTSLTRSRAQADAHLENNLGIAD